MTLDTNQLYQQLNKSISVSIEDLFINRLNKIFSIDNDIELVKLFLGDALSIYKKVQQISDKTDGNNSLDRFIKIFDVG